MDQWVVTVDQFTIAMTYIQEASASPRQEIDSQQSRQFVVQDETPCDSVPHLPPSLDLEDAHPYIDRIEQRIRQLRLFGSSSTWDDLDSIPVASPLAKFRMPDIERYMVVGCLYTYLRLYSTGKIAEIVDRPLQRDDSVLMVIRELIRDPRGKFRPNWSGPYFIRELTPEGAAWLMDLDGNRFSEPTNVDQLKSFLSFLLPYHPSLRYVPCLKTTLRPWDQMSSLTASAWAGLIQLCSDYRVVSLTMIDLVSPGFWLIIYGSSWSCTLIPTYEIHIDTMFPPWSLSGVTQLGLHFAMLRCHHAFLPRDAPLIYGSDSVVHLLCERYLGLIREHSDCDGPGVMDTNTYESMQRSLVISGFALYWGITL
ncbi:hypothetical protein CK203_080732 [Vitis vinifera]|uniref:Uncharacterized protein n=1 Tax=Vitis vinifera TaxID=29760 RepID=A0A438DZP2_VITVI|nr:hypothetical protein CK203_080732 [Vitis vinifera]